MACYSLYPQIEGLSRRYVSKSRCARQIIVACAIGNYLGKLGTGDVRVWPKVWLAIRYTWLTRASTLIAADDIKCPHAFNVLRKDVGGWHILESTCVRGRRRCS